MSNQAIELRKALPADFSSIWRIIEPIVSAGDTYAIPTDIGREEAYRLWMDMPLVTYVAVVDGEILGTFYLKANQAGGGSHVCNCAYMVSAAAQGRGLATTMCQYSQDAAVELGFSAMQFNLVLSTNHVAVKLWQKLGFEIVGTLPKAFDHPVAGLIDAHVMYKWLAAD